MVYIDTQEDNTEGCYVLFEHHQAFCVYACKIRTFNDKCHSHLCKFFFRIEIIMQKVKKKVKEWTMRSISHMNNSKNFSSKLVVFNYNSVFSSTLSEIIHGHNYPVRLTLTPVIFSEIL